MTDPALPLIELKPGLEIELEPAQEKLLQYLFDDCRYVVIEREFGGGYTSTRVFLATPWRETELAPLVVKIGPLDLINDEKDRFKTFVAERLPLMPAEIKRFIRHEPLAAIAYTYLGGVALGPGTCSLRDYYRQHPADQILEVLRHLLEALGECWYEKRRLISKPRYFKTDYGRFFPADLILTLDALNQTEWPASPDYNHFPVNTPPWKYEQIKPGQAVQLDGFVVTALGNTWIEVTAPEGSFRVRLNFKPSQSDWPEVSKGQPLWLRGQVVSNRQDELERITAAAFAGVAEVELNPAADTVTLAGRSYPNPLKFYPDYLNDPLPPNLSIIHGDLRPCNIVVDSYQKPWLLDFGRVGEGHILFDFVELETSLRHEILSEHPFSLAELIDFEHRLVLASTAAELPPPPTQPDLAKAYTIIRGIRAFAAHFLSPRRGLREEYFPALYLYTLLTLKYYRSNGLPSARHTFISATMLVASLKRQFDNQETPPAPSETVLNVAANLTARQLDDHEAAPTLTLADPALEQHNYYLKNAAYDTPTQQAARRQLFMTELQRAADTLRRSLGLPPEPVTWEDEPPAGRHMMVLRYFSGRWQAESNQTLVWLLAYEMNDTYLLRLILCHPGQGYSPDIFVAMRQNFPWQPEINSPEWVGQSLFYIALSPAAPVELAGAILGDSLLHTSLICGELFTRRAIKPDPYLLLCATPEQDRQAGDFFDRLAPLLGWYTHKASQQEQRYEIYLYPELNRLEQSLSTMLTEANRLHQALELGEKDFEALSAFHQSVRNLETAIPSYDDQLTFLTNILTTVEINVEDYGRVAGTDEFLRQPGSNKIFEWQLHQLEFLPRQIRNDLKPWQNLLEQTRRTLEVLRPVANRFPLVDRDPAQIAASIQAHLPVGSPLFEQFEVELTLLVDDIKDSTPYVTQYGDRQWQQLAQQHNDLLHPLILQHHGRVVKNTGDGSLAVFPDTIEAVQAALEIQAALHRHNCAALPINQLHVRLGLHTGRALLSATDVLGLAVNLATRVCGQADAGEVVISEATYCQAGDVAAGFAALGPRQLKGIAEPVLLYRKTLQE